MIWQTRASPVARYSHHNRGTLPSPKLRLHPNHPMGGPWNCSDVTGLSLLPSRLKKITRTTEMMQNPSVNVAARWFVDYFTLFYLFPRLFVIL